MKILIAITACALIASYWADREKTHQALKLTLQKIKRFGVPFAWAIVLAAATVELLNELNLWRQVFDASPLWSTLSAAGVGSFALMPGAVAFPLGAILLQQGISHMVVAGFTVALMTVGVVTFPLERAFLGTRVAVIRNVIGFAIALCVAIGIGFAYGELP
ncbi:MAG: hypothetical protein JXX14_01060 [Deltaproteobacteria bacterium]|nr:hypothetical protein [Deltaproteobacteria bacterium]